MSGRLARLCVRLSAWIVPRAARARWREEWLGELDAVSRGQSRPGLGRVLGAPIDALATRRLGDRGHTFDPPHSRLRALMPSAADARQAWRTVCRTPIVSLASVLALAVGLGLTVVAYTIVRGIFYLPLPGPDGGRIVRMTDFDTEFGHGLDVSIAEFERRRAALRTVDDAGGFNEREVRWGLDEAARMVTAAFVTPNTMDLLGVRPVAGRDLMRADSLPHGADAVLVRETLAVTQFGSARAAVGERIAVDGRSRTIVGVMPASCRFPFISDLWIPFASTAGSGPAPEQAVRMFGRLSQGTTAEQAAAELTAIASAGPDRPNEDQVVSLVSPFGRPPGPPEQEFVAWAFVAAVGLLLFVAAANVAWLMLARTAARREELAVRAALGASRARLTLQLGLEGLALGLLAAVAGTAGALAALRWFRMAIPDLPYWVRFDLDPGPSLVMIGLAVTVSIVIGVLPALRLTGRRDGYALTRTAATLRFGRTSSLLIAAEAAVAIGLLCGAAALGQALFRFGAHERRLPAEDVLVAQLYFGAPPESRMDGYQQRPQAERRALWREWDASADARQRTLRDELLVDPGVRGVSRASHFPGNPAAASPFELAAGDDVRSITTRAIQTDEHLFDLLDAAPIAGRTLARQDVDEDAPVVVVNEPFVQRHLAGGPALGRRLRRVGADGARGPWLAIVGVVPDLGINPGAPSLADGVYLPLAPASVVRFGIRADRLDAVVARVHERADAGQPVADVQWTMTLAEQLDQPVFLYRGVGYALTSLGLVALLLACTGIHALVSLSVNERRRELAVRVALGAGRGRLVRSVLSRTIWQLVIGVAAGLVLAMGVVQAVALMPFDLDDSDPSFVLLAIGLLTLAGLAACLKPLRQALALRPVDWLR